MWSNLCNLESFQKNFCKRLMPPTSEDYNKMSHSTSNTIIYKLFRHWIYLMGWSLKPQTHTHARYGAFFCLNKEGKIVAISGRPWFYSFCTIFGMLKKNIPWNITCAFFLQLVRIKWRGILLTDERMGKQSSYFLIGSKLNEGMMSKELKILV